MNQPKTSKAKATPQLNVMIAAARNGDFAETSCALKGEWTSDAAVQEVRKRVQEYDALCKVAAVAANAYELLGRTRCGDSGLNHIQKCADCELDLRDALSPFAQRRGNEKV